MTGSAAVLSTHDLVKHFGGVRAVDGVSISIPPGSITGLIGPNGAGKTTLFNLISGLLRPDRGAVFLKGQAITGLSPSRICRLGLTRTFQIARGLRQMTVMENLLLAPKEQIGESLPRAILRDRGVWFQERSLRERAHGVLESVGLAGRESDLASQLSGGERKMLEVARALMTEPEVLLLDEPTAGTTREETDRIMSYLAQLQARGLTLVIVEHKMEVIMRLCQTIVVLDRGRVIAQGTPAEVQRDPRVVEAYLGA